MLDNLYEDIGGKIKNWAKWIFIVEAIGSLIAGCVFFMQAQEYDNEIFYLYGFLTLIVGPIVAWVGSWILYAFGELVEDVHAIRSKQSLALANTTATPRTTSTYTYTSQSSAKSPPARVAPVANGWTCTCGKNHAPYESSCVCGMTKGEVMIKNRQSK